MTTEEIIGKLRRGDVIYVYVGNRYAINGIVEGICYVEPLGEDSFYAIQLNFNGQTVNLDSRDDIEILNWTEHEGEEYTFHSQIQDNFEKVLEKYHMDINNLLSEIVERWNEWNDEEKEEICDAVKNVIETQDLKDILDLVQLKNDTINQLSEEAKKLTDKLIAELEKGKDFLERYEAFKKFIPGLESVYDFLLYKVWGYH